MAEVLGLEDVWSCADVVKVIVSPATVLITTGVEMDVGEEEEADVDEEV